MNDDQEQLVSLPEETDKPGPHARPVPAPFTYPTKVLRDAPTFKAA